MTVVAHDLVVEAVSSRKHLVENAAARIARISAGPNERLAEKRAKRATLTSRTS